VKSFFSVIAVFKKIKKKKLKIYTRESI